MRRSSYFNLLDVEQAALKFCQMTAWTEKRFLLQCPMAFGMDFKPAELDTIKIRKAFAQKYRENRAPQMRRSLQQEINNVIATPLKHLFLGERV